MTGSFACDREAVDAPGGGSPALIRQGAIYGATLHLKIAAKANGLFYLLEQ